MGAKNSRHNKEEEKKTESSVPDRGHQYDVIEDDDLIKNREEEEKRKQNAENVKNALESRESNDNTSPSNSSTRPRLHPYDNVVLGDDRTGEQSPTTDETKDKDAIKVNTKAKDKKVKKEEKKEEQKKEEQKKEEQKKEEQKKKEDKKREKKKDEKSKEVKEIPPIIVLPVAPAGGAPEDVEYTNVTAIKKAEEIKESEMTTEDGSVYALPLKMKKKDKRESKKTEPQISTEPQPVKQLNYIEVEIIPKSPASPKTEMKSPKKHEPLTYSNIVRENGKIVLVPDQ